MSIFVLMRCLVLRRLNLFFGATVAYTQTLTKQPVTCSDSTVWYIRNNTVDTLYPTSLTFKVHHMLPTAAILSIYIGPGFFNNTQKIAIKGSKYNWKYATSFGCSFEDTMFHGISIPIAVCVNYNSASKTEASMR